MAILSSWLLGTKPNLNENDQNDFVPYIGSDFAGDGAPKSKFLFTVEFGVNLSFLRGVEKESKGAEELGQILLDLKNASRPEITIQYEDVNYYGIRTKVATKTNFGQLRLTFYEDAFNNAHNLLWGYMKKVSPLANTKTPRIITPSSGESVNDPSSFKPLRKTTIGPLPDGWQDGIIEYIKVHHHYIGGNHEAGGITTYTYYNPKLEHLQYDELDMSTSDPATITAIFHVDAVTVSDKESGTGPETE